MLDNPVIKDRFGQHYKVHTRREKFAASALREELFHSREHASQLIRNLIAPLGYWRDLARNESYSLDASGSNNYVQNEVAQLFYRGKIKLYKIDIVSNSECLPEKRTFQDQSNNNHTFMPVSSLLISRPKELKTFNDKTQAEQFLEELNPDKKQLKELSQQLDITTAPEPTMSDEGYKLLISEALVNGTVVVAVDRYSSPPKAEETLLDKASNAVGNRKAELGAGVSVPSSAAVADEIVHTCRLSKMTLSCKHGRSVTLDPAKAIDKKTGMPVIPYLAVTSMPVSSPQKDQELITAKIDIDDVCDSHIKSPYSISSDAPKLVNTNFGKVIKFYSPGEDLDIATEFYKFIWLPSVKPASYKVSPPDFCKIEKFDGKAKSIRVDVYPDIKWDFGLDIGYGQIKVSDTSPTQDVVKRTIDQEVFSISGKAKCTHGSNSSIEFVDKFSNKFDAIKSEIDGQNDLLSKIFSKFEEGDNHSVTLDLPVLSFNGSSSIAEKKGSPDVDIKWDYNIKAAPLIGITAEVDVLPMLLKSSAWGSLFLPLLSELKEKYANPDGSVGVQLEASIILSIAGKVEFDLSFTDSSFVGDEKEKLDSLKFDVPFVCEGKLQGKGHLLIFSAELGVIAKINSGFAYEMFMGADDGGIYRSSILHFHGIEFEIKAYIEGKKEVPGNNEMEGDGGLFSNTQNTSAKRLDYNNKWTWIEKRKIEFTKEYVVHNA